MNHEDTKSTKEQQEELRNAHQLFTLLFLVPFVSSCFISFFDVGPHAIAAG
jgi:hypothetical protein